MKRLLFPLLLLFSPLTAAAQNVGINTDSPETALDVNGALRTREAFAMKPATTSAGSTIELDGTASVFIVSDDGASAANAATYTGTPLDGQVLTVVNDDEDNLTFAGTTVEAGTTRVFVYDGSDWVCVQGGDSHWKPATAGGIYYDGGNVGIGTDMQEPASTLHVRMLAEDLEIDGPSCWTAPSLWTTTDPIFQTITMTANGSWTKCTFYFLNPLAGTKTFTFYEGEGTGGSVLHQTTHTFASGETGFVTVTLTLTPAIDMEAGEVFTVEMDNAHSVLCNYFNTYLDGYSILTDMDLLFATQFVPSASGFHVTDTGVDIGTATPTGMLDVSGSAVIGASYSGTTAAPANGLLVEGNVGIGVAAPTEKLEVDGKTKTANLQLTSGAADGYFLQSDAAGNAFWVDVSMLESDPQVSSTTTNYVPKWNGTTLTDGMIYDNGNVGIGTDDPLTLFHVRASEAYAEGPKSTTYFGFFTNAVPSWQSLTATVNGTWTACSLYFYAPISGTRNITIYEGTGTAGTQVGQGTVTFTGTEGSGYQNIPFVAPVSVTTGAVYTIAIDNRFRWGFSDSNPYAGGQMEAFSDRDFAFITTLAPETLDFHISASGVGVGTSTPEAQLEVEGTTKTTTLQMTSGATSGYVLRSDASGNATWVNPTTLAITETDPQVSSTTTNYVPKWNGTTLTDGSIYDNGNVGIGDATPDGKLDVEGLLRMNDQAIVLRTDGDNNHGLSYSNNFAGSAMDGPVLYGWASGALGTKTGGDRMVLYWNSNGRVGIGTNNPGYPLHVTATAVSATMGYGYLNRTAPTGTCGSCTGTYSAYFSSRVAAEEFNAFSDRRIKTVQRGSNTREDLEKLLKLQVTDYTHIDTISKGTEIQKGFIAQEVAQIVPEAVTKVKEFVPDVYQLASSVEKTDNGLILTLPKAHSLVTGDSLKLIASSGDLYAKVSRVGGNQIELTGLFETAPEQVFVFGRLVNDFHVLDYDRLYTLGIGAIQELVKDNAELRSDLNDLKQMMKHLDARVDSLEQEDNSQHQAVLQSR